MRETEQEDVESSANGREGRTKTKGDNTEYTQTVLDFNMDTLESEAEFDGGPETNELSILRPIPLLLPIVLYSYSRSNIENEPRWQ